MISHHLFGRSLTFQNPPRPSPQKAKVTRGADPGWEGNVDKRSDEHKQQQQHQEQKQRMTAAAREHGYPGECHSPGGHENKRNATFPQLDDFSSLDLIYKRALLVARVAGSGEGSSFAVGNRDEEDGNSDDGKIPATATARRDARAHRGPGFPSNANRSGEWVGRGTGWAASDPAASRAWSVAHRLMDLLATGMAANMERRRTEDG